MYHYLLMISLCELLTIVIESNLWAELTMNHIYHCSVKFHRQKSSRLRRNPNYEFRIRTKKCPMQILLVSWSHKCCQVDKQKAVSVYFYLSNVSCIPSVMFLPAKFCWNFSNVSTPLIDCINLQHHLCLRCTSAYIAFGKRFPDQSFKPVLWTE